MSKWPKYPSVYEINILVWLNTLSQKYKTPITLKNIPQEELYTLSALGFDAVWLMGIWQRSPGATEEGRNHPDLKREYEKALPGYTNKDVTGSPYAIYSYTVDPAIGNMEELIGLKGRLSALKMKLILDFVPNHLALDHPWTESHPCRFVKGTEEDMTQAPTHYYKRGDHIFGHGRDWYYSWEDTVQLDYRNKETREAMKKTLKKIAALCDGVRCDMAMLLLHDIFLKTWGGTFDPPEFEFWKEAISEIKKEFPHFLFIGEVYWEQEGPLLNQGFDFVYDKTLYDKVTGDYPPSVKDYLGAMALPYQSKLARFVENHDEKRILTYKGFKQSIASAVLSFTLPGLRLFHEGQLEGAQIKLPVQLGRRPHEEPIKEISIFYKDFLAILKNPIFKEGEWEILWPLEAPGDSFRNIAAWVWSTKAEKIYVAVNLSPWWAQCYLPLKQDENENRTVKELFEERGVEADQLPPLPELRIYLDIPAYGYRIFKIN